jgi:hypothetical protein
VRAGLTRAAGTGREPTSYANTNNGGFGRPTHINDSQRPNGSQRLNGTHRPNGSQQLPPGQARVIELRDIEDAPAAGPSGFHQHQGTATVNRGSQHQGRATGNRGSHRGYNQDAAHASVLLFLCGLSDLLSWLWPKIQPIFAFFARLVFDTRSQQGPALAPWLRVTVWVLCRIIEMGRWIAGCWPCRVLLFILGLMLRCYIRAERFMLGCATWPVRLIGRRLAVGPS